MVKIGIGVPFRLDDLFLLYLACQVLLRKQIRSTFAVVALGLFTTSALVSLLLATASGEDLSFAEANNCLVFARILLVVAVVQQCIRSFDDIQAILNALYVATCVSACVAVVQYFKVEPVYRFLFELYAGPDRFRQLYVDESHLGHVYRVVATIGNPNHAELAYSSPAPSPTWVLSA